MLSVHICDLITLLIIAKVGQGKDVYVPENVYRTIVHACKISSFFNSILHYAPDIVTIRVLNGDQLWVHVYIA